MPETIIQSQWTVDDLINQESASQFDLSPCGQWAVWVKTTADKDKDERVSNLILSSLSGEREIELTRGSESSYAPRWSPDGEHIAFISQKPLPKAKPDDEKKPHLWVLSAHGGEPWPLTEGERGVAAFAWIDAGTLVFAAQEEPALYEKTHKEKKDKSLIVDDEAHAPPVRLFRVDLKEKKVIRLTDNADRIEALWVAPDGRHAVTLHERSLHHTYDEKIKPVVCLYDLQTGQGQFIFTGAGFNVRHVEWKRDSSGFYAISAYSRHPQYTMAAIYLLYEYDLASGAVAPVDLDWPNGLMLLDQGLVATGDGFLCLLAHGARPQAARYTRQQGGWTRQPLDGDHVENLYALALAQDGQNLVYRYTTASIPGQWYRARLDGAAIREPARLTHLNKSLDGKPFARTEIVRWIGARGDEVEGLLHYPRDYQVGKRYPLVVAIHGGPAWADLDAWDEGWGRPFSLIAQRGAFILQPNYHGSAFYGLDWVESIGNGNYCDLEVPDIERGVDALIARGLVDPEQLGVMGWSNGGILTIALTVHTARYKVASAGAGDVDWASDWGNCAFGGAFDTYYLGKPPYQDPQLYVDKSPFYKLDRVHTPTIIFFGSEDRAVPTQQGWMHFRALQQLEKTDVRFVLFPGEEHGLKKLTSQRRKVEEELAWLDRYLFRTFEAKNEAIKPGSPLDVALKLRKVARVDGRYGLLHQGVLIPEMVSFKGIELGRFEVTRAQYAAFDGDYAVAPGTDNYPANGITLAQAQAYCEWVSKLTGEVYRLGGDKEMEPIYEAKGERENTLDHWAGYAVNPDDAARLQVEIAGFDQDASLLAAVGSFAPPEGEAVFDLGGNVAEWALKEDGSGVVLGGSADTPADARIGMRAPAPAYVGFRVVKGKPQEKSG